MVFQCHKAYIFGAGETAGAVQLLFAPLLPDGYNAIAIRPERPKDKLGNVPMSAKKWKFSGLLVVVGEGKPTC